MSSVSIIFLFLPLFSHHGLYQQSPIPSIGCSFFLHFFPLFRYLFYFGLPHLVFPSTFWASALFAIFPSLILSTWPAHFNLFLFHFFLKLQPSLSQFIHSSLINSLSFHVFSYQVVFAKFGPFCCFSVSAIISRALCRGNTELITIPLGYFTSISHNPFDFPLSVCPCCNPHDPNPGIFWMVRNGGPITGCLIHRFIKYKVQKV